MKKQSYLCIVIDRCTNEELAEYRIEALEEYFSRHIAAGMFENDQKYQPRLRKHENWYVDSCEI